MARTLFVVDDSATMRKVFELTFAGEDVTVITHDGAEGVVARAREVRPHAAIVDVALGGAVGYDVVRSLRADAGLATVPIYLLYSDHSPLDEAAARACGAAGALAKPFDTQAMIDRVRQAFSMTAGAPAPSASPVGNLTQPFGSPAAAAAAAALRAAPPAATTPTAPAPRPAAAPAVPPASPAARGPVVPPARHAAPPSAARAPATPTGRESELSLDDLATARAPALAPSAAPRPMAQAPLAVPRVLQPHAPEPSPPELSRQVAHEIHAKVSHLGLTQAQVEAVTALTKEVVERVVWEVVPQLAETLIREEIKRLTAE